MVPSGREWKTEEIQQLLELAQNRPAKDIIWSEIANSFENRTSIELRNKYIYIMPGINKGKWTIEEDLRIEVGFRVFGPNFSKIASTFAGCNSQRTDVQIRDRWSNVLSKQFKKGTWTKEEEEEAIKMVNQMRSEDVDEATIWHLAE